MNPKQHVSLNQVALLIPTATFGGYIYLFREIVARAGRAGWLMQAASSIPIMALALWILWLASCRPENTIFEILQNGTGKIIGKNVLYPLWIHHDNIIGPKLDAIYFHDQNLPFTGFSRAFSININPDNLIHCCVERHGTSGAIGHNTNNYCYPHRFRRDRSRRNRFF